MSIITSHSLFGVSNANTSWTLGAGGVKIGISRLRKPTYADSSALRQPAVLLIAAALLGAGVTGVYSLAREQRQTKTFEAERAQALAALSQARG